MKRLIDIFLFLSLFFVSYAGINERHVSENPLINYFYIFSFIFFSSIVMVFLLKEKPVKTSIVYMTISSILLFFLFSISSFDYSERLHSFVVFAVVFFMWLFGFYLYLETYKNADSISLIFFIFALFSSLVSIYIYLEGLTPSIRLVGWFGTPNRLASIAAIGFLFGMSFKPKTTASYYIKICGLALLYLVVFFSGSRSDFIALNAVVFIFLFATNYFRALLVCVTALALIAILFVGSIDFDQVDINVWQRNFSNIDRLARYYDAISIFLNGTMFSALFGNGYGYFYDYIGHSPDSLYIYIIVGHGVVAFFAFAFVLIRQVIWVFNSKLFYVGYSWLPLYILIEGAFSSSALSYRPLMLALCFSLASFSYYRFSGNRSMIDQEAK